MKRDESMQRRMFLRTVAAGSIATTAAVASTFPRPAIAQGKMEWRIINVWGEEPSPWLRLFAKLVSEGSEGRMTIRCYGPGQIVPLFETIDAVAEGKVEMGTAASPFWARKVPAMAYIYTIPFGLTAQEQNAWFEFGGGQELADKVYGEVGCKFFPFGNTGLQMGGWFKKEINSISDLKGLKIRIVGLGGATLKAAGAEVVSLPFGKVAQALKDGEIEAAEWIGPYHDMEDGFHKLAKYYYYPGWHEPSGAFDLFINRAKWEALPSNLKAIIAAAAANANQYELSRRVGFNTTALATLVREHGVQLKQFPNDVLKELARVSQEILRERASKDKLSEEILNSIMEFRKKASGWSAVSLQPYLATRASIL